MFKFHLATALGLSALLFLSSCQSALKPGPGPLTLTSSQAALPIMEMMSQAATACWFKSKEKDFRVYKMAAELNSFSGRPRFLLVPVKNPTARPLLVVQAEGNPAKIEVFGPMMGQPVGSKIAHDVKLWAEGQKKCS
ncbi:hypothetical protein [Paenochrobactrum gallinarii]